jgi:hypothetical protein
MEVDDGEATNNMQDNWQLEKKNIFVLSSAGKPIFSRFI